MIEEPTEMEQVEEAAEEIEGVEATAVPPTPPPAKPKPTWESIAIIPLILILLLAAYFRFTGLDWDANHHLHPDERFLTDTTSRLQVTFDPFLYLRTSESPPQPLQRGQRVLRLRQLPYDVYTLLRRVGDAVV